MFMGIVGVKVCSWIRLGNNLKKCLKCGIVEFFCDRFIVIFFRGFDFFLEVIINFIFTLEIILKVCKRRKGDGVSEVFLVGRI